MTSPSKVYIVKFKNKRYSNKTFTSYDAARNYARRSITKKFGSSADAIGDFGFSVVAK